MVDALASGASELRLVEVQIFSSPPFKVVALLLQKDFQKDTCSIENTRLDNSPIIKYSIPPLSRPLRRLLAWRLCS